MSFKIDNYTPSINLIMDTEYICKSCGGGGNGNYTGTGFFGQFGTVSINGAIDLLRQPSTYYPTQFGLGLGTTGADPSTIIIGNHVDSTGPNCLENSVNIGIKTGQIDQSSNAIAIGFNSGYNSQQLYGTSIGYLMLITKY